MMTHKNDPHDILHTVAAALNTEADLTKVLATVLETLAQVTSVETGWVWLLHEDTHKPYLAASYNLPPALADYPQRMYGSCFCLDEFADGRLDTTEHYSNVICSRLKKLREGTRGLRYHASAPLTRSGRKLGVMNLTFQDQQPWSEDQLRLVNTIADMLAVAIERAQLFERSMALGAAEERNRLAREIHDTIAQGLAGIALQLETADALMEMGTDEATLRQAITRALVLTRASIEEARRSVMDLRAAPLEGRTLPQALAELAAQTPHPEAHTHIIGEDQPLPAHIEVGLYRIAQEAVNNAIQHANASQLHLALVITPGDVTLTVNDDGAGAPIVQAGHFGLIGMNERAKLLGGQLTIGTSESGGTRVHVRVTLSGGKRGSD